MKLTTQELQEKIDNGEKFIVDLYADWCGPCRMIGPIVEKVAQQLKEEGSEVRSIPAIKGFNGGENVTNKIGVITEVQLLDMVKEVL